MNKKIMKIQCTRETMDEYLSQANVIRRTNMSANTNYGKICSFSDADVDG